MPVLGILLRTISLLRLCFPPSGNDSVSWNLPTHSSSPPPCSLPSSTLINGKQKTAQPGVFVFRRPCRFYQSSLGAMKPISDGVTRFRRIRGCRCVLKARAHLAVSSGTIAAAGACVPAGAVILCGGFDHIAGPCILGSRAPMSPGLRWGRSGFPSPGILRKKTGSLLLCCSLKNSRLPELPRFQRYSV